MEYILMALFDGGTADWNDIGKTYYDWYDIVERVKDEYGLEYADINTFYNVIMEMGLEQLEKAMQDYDDEKSEEFEKCAENIRDYFEIYPNCLASSINFTGEKELATEIQEKLEEELEQIDHDLAFTYICFD